MLKKTGKAAALAMGLSAAVAGFAGAAGISTYSFTTCNLPDTGQGASYTATFGEDHDYYSAASTPSFTVYSRAGSSVTVDNRTGLMWVTNPNDAAMSGTYTWENAIAACEYGIGAAGTYAGYSDWRLPNIKELVSIVDYGTTASAKINGTYFLNTQANYYWSSTTYVPSTTYAWLVYFTNGYVTSYDKTSTYYVRCVRGGP